MEFARQSTTIAKVFRLLTGKHRQNASVTAATLILKPYGDKAPEQSRTRIHELAADGDNDGADTWRRITTAREQLANTTPPGSPH